MKAARCSFGLAPLIALSAALVVTCIRAQAADSTAAPGSPTHGQAVEIHHCAGGPSLTIAATDARAFLDDGERDALLADMLARYPILVRDSFAPPVIMLWRKAPGEWLYVSLRPGDFANKAVCFTATFVARIFRITPSLNDKYFNTRLPD